MNPILDYIKENAKIDKWKIWEYNKYENFPNLILRQGHEYEATIFPELLMITMNVKEGTLITSKYLDDKKAECDTFSAADPEVLDKLINLVESIQ